MNRSLRILAAIFGLCAVPPLLSLPAKDYFFPEVRINVGIQRDGSFVVDEFRTFEFEGTFSAAWVFIPLNVDRQGTRYNVRIEEFRVLDENGQELKTETSAPGGVFKAEWSFRAQNERRTFHFHYRIRGGIFSYPDVSERTFSFMGTDRFRAGRRLPTFRRPGTPRPISRPINIWKSGLSGRPV
jgi:hypothetical protein